MSASISCVVLVRVHSQANSTPRPPHGFYLSPTSWYRGFTQAGANKPGQDGGGGGGVTSHVKFPTACFSNIYAEIAENRIEWAQRVRPQPRLLCVATLMLRYDCLGFELHTPTACPARH